jgi:hypothetical protein
MQFYDINVSVMGLHTLQELAPVPPAEAAVSAHVGTTAVLEHAPEGYVGHRRAADEVQTPDLAPAELPLPPERAERDVRYGFEAAEHAMGNLVQELAPGIREGRWGTILGDDASGRLPALVIGEVTKKWNADHDLAKPAQQFVAAGRVKADALPDGQAIEAATAEKAAALGEYLEHVKPKMPGRVLVVTEHVKRHGITMLARQLHDHGIPFDLAVVESRHTPAEHMAGWRDQYPEVFDGVDMYVGQDNMHYPVFKEEDALRVGSGVTRASEAPVAAPLPGSAAYVTAARQEIATMGDKLYRNIVQ